jgi:hypothetical protein
MSRKKIGEAKQVFVVDKWHLDNAVDEGISPSYGDALKGFTNLFTDIFRSKGYKNFDIVFQ